MTKKLCFCLLFSWVTMPTVMVSMIRPISPSQLLSFVVGSATSQLGSLVASGARCVGGGVAVAGGATGHGLKVAGAGVWSGVQKTASGTASGWRWFWGKAPQAEFEKCEDAGKLAECPAQASKSERQEFVNYEKYVRWARDLKDHGEVKGRAIRFVVTRSLLHTALGAAAGAVVGGTVMHSLQDAAGMAVVAGGVSGTLSALCQHYRARFDRIAEHKNQLIRQAVQDKISPIEVVNIKSKIKTKNSWLDRRDVDDITGKVFECNHGQTLLKTETDKDVLPDEFPIAMDREVAKAINVPLLEQSRPQPEVQSQADQPKSWLRQQSIVGRTGAAVFRHVYRYPEGLCWLAQVTASALGSAAQAAGKGAWNLWWGRPAQLLQYDYSPKGTINASSICPSNLAQTKENLESQERTKRLKLALVFTSQEKARAVRNVTLRTTLNAFTCAAIGGVAAYGAGCKAADVAGWATASGTAGSILASVYTYYRSKIDSINERRPGVVAASLKDGIQASEVQVACTQAQQEVGWWSRFGIKHTVNELLDLKSQKCRDSEDDCDIDLSGVHNVGELV